VGPGCHAPHSTNPATMLRRIRVKESDMQQISRRQGFARYACSQQLISGIEPKIVVVRYVLADASTIIKQQPNRVPDCEFGLPLRLCREKSCRHQSCRSRHL